MKPSDRQLIVSAIDRDYPHLEELYRHLHAHPELSGQERETSRRIADELRNAGGRVTEGVGGYGVVGVVKNGSGPTLLLRADLDALPISEETGLPYASRVRSESGPVPAEGVMHACGHDLHCTILVGAARLLSREKSWWRGNLVLVGQPAEETGGGALAMIADGLYRRFPRPDYVLGLHVYPALPAGSVGFREGMAWAGMAGVEITVRGIGGHGALPQLTRSPVVLAARLVLALQNIVSREIDPLRPAVVSVGSINGGKTANVIPDEVRLQLTVRFFDDEVKNKIFSALSRLCRELAESAGLPEQLMPVIRERAENCYPPLYNDPELTRRVTGTLVEALGGDKVSEIPRQTLSDDFANYRLSDPPIPSLYLMLGVSDPGAIGKLSGENQSEADLRESARFRLHTPHFAPLPEPSIKTGVRVLGTAARELLGVAGAGGEAAVP